MKLINKMTAVATLTFLVPVLFSGCTSTTKSKELDPIKMTSIATTDMSSSAVELKTAMRKLWEDHVVWTRNVVFCIMDDLPGTNQAVTRLMKNQDEIGSAISTYYGEKAGKQLTDLLHVHISTAAEFLKASRKGDTKAADEANKRWIQNADDISAFLSKANPNWKPVETKMMMREHLSLTTNEAVARKAKNYDYDVIAYDKVNDAILKMADMLSDGIIKQFPNKFKELPVKM